MVKNINQMKQKEKRLTCTWAPPHCWGRRPPVSAARAERSGSAAVYWDPCGPRACPPAAPCDTVLTSRPNAARPLREKHKPVQITREQLHYWHTHTQHDEKPHVRGSIQSTPTETQSGQRSEVRVGDTRLIHERFIIWHKAAVFLFKLLHQKRKLKRSEAEVCKKKTALNSPEWRTQKPAELLVQKTAESHKHCEITNTRLTETTTTTRLTPNLHSLTN